MFNRIGTLERNINKEEMCRLVGPHSKLTVKNKCLTCVAIIKPIWTNGIQLWRCISKSNNNIDVMEHCQDIALWIIVAVHRLERHNKIYLDNMMLSSIYNSSRNPKVCLQTQDEARSPYQFISHPIIRQQVRI